MRWEARRISLRPSPNWTTFWRYVLEFEPAMTHVKAVWDVVGQVGESINDIASNMNRQKFDEAQNILDAGQIVISQDETVVRRTRRTPALGKVPAVLHACARQAVLFKNRHSTSVGWPLSKEKHRGRI